MVLTKQHPPDAPLIAASVGAWQTEEIGFEVSGRVEFVADLNTEIDGRIYDSDGNRIVEGTPVARLESERYSLQVSRAKSEVKRAEQNLVVAQTELDESIPAQIEAAAARAELAKTELDRSQTLKQQNAVSQSEFDEKTSAYRNAVAEVKQVLASETSKKAEIEALKNAILQAKQSLRDAQRDLEDCTLYSSFRGQIAGTSVVPGSIVTAGQSVATLQMMDPIKIEVEISADKSRQMQRMDRFPIHVSMPDGSSTVHEAVLHQIDPVADPLTRTFTLTLLLFNRKLSDSAGVQAATTSDVWRLDLKFLPGAENGGLFAEESSILYDSEGAYLWQITNTTIQGHSPADHVVEVRKLRVEPSPLKVPYLGRTVFQEVKVNDPEFDASRDLVVGKLRVADGTPEQWNGKTVFLDAANSWMLRPGDIVKVDLSATDSVEGYYVPMDAISRQADGASVFVVRESGGQTIAARVPVKGVNKGQTATPSSLQLIELSEDAEQSDNSLEGARLITAGVHYLIDGEPINVIAPSETAL
ncbi:HlyD family efflux transporter periplasmic adaptor subunit [Rubripirellula amarantea]|nr:HlyD family efflux transporter periplasmic adaptor subunit [Rubripirellula amarantea]